MKKLRFILALALVLCLGLTACGGAGSSAPAGSGSTPASTPASSQAGGSEAGSLPAVTTVNPGKLTLATEATFPPYEYMSGTEVVGVDIDIASEIAAALGLELVIEEMPFDAILAAVDSGKADLGAAGLSVTPERAEQVDFSITYATSKQIILTRGDAGISGEGDLAGKTVGVQLGTTGDIVLTEDYPDVTVERYNRYTDAVNDLINGRLDAMVLDSLPAAELQKLDDGLVICEDELLTDEYAICVKKGNTALLGAIDQVLQGLIDEGKVDELTTKHLA